MTIRRYLVLVALVALALGGAQGAAAQDAPEESDADRVQSLVQPSVVYLQTTYSAPIRDVNPRYRGTNLGGVQFGGERVPVSTRCSGFFVHPEGWVGTAGHCVLPDASTRQAIIQAAGERAYEEGQFTDSTTLEDAVAYAEEHFRLAGGIQSAFLVAYATDAPTVSRDEAVSARLVGYRSFDKGDVALLKFEPRGVDFPGLELAPDEEVRVGMPIVAVGFPGNVDNVADADYNPSFKGGEISSVKTAEGGQFTLYEHDASVSGGMSGGPVVDSDGRVIGVTSRGTNAIAEGFDFAVPVSILLEIMGGRVENEIGTVGTTYREGVEAYYDGNKSTALDRLDEVLNNPGNPALALAADIRGRAQLLEDESSFNWLYVLIGALVVAGIVAAVVVLSRRSSSPATLQPVVLGPSGGAAAAPAPSPLATPAPQAQQPAAPAAPPRPAQETRISAETATGEGKPALVVEAQRGETAVRFVLEGEMLVGRENADILLEDEQVSRRHAQITVGGNRVEITDVGSANGTEVNGERISTTVTLSHGDAIKVGTTTLKLELPPSMRGPAPGDATVVADR